VGRFAVVIDGKRLAYTANGSEIGRGERPQKKYGEFQFVDQDQRMTRLFASICHPESPARSTPDAFTVGSFAWCADARASHSITAEQQSRELRAPPTSPSSPSPDASVRKLVTQDGPDNETRHGRPTDRRSRSRRRWRSELLLYEHRDPTVSASGGTPTS